jgi:hypothetical protein
MFDHRVLGGVALATLSLSLAVDPAVSAVPTGSLAPHAAQNGPVTVEATARGPSAAEARKAAIVAALRKVVGEYVEADVVIANDEVVKDEILSFSNAGGVESEQVGEPKLVGDEVEVTMRVTVEPKPLVARVKGAAKAGAKLDGAALAAEIAAAKDDYKAKKRVLEKAFAELPDAFMTIRIVDSEGNDTTGIDRELVEIDRGTGNATITIPIVLGFDKGVWRNVVHPALDQVLTAAADRKVVDGLIVDRRKDMESPRVRFTGRRTTLEPQPRSRPWQTRDSFTVALMRENLGRGRQFNFDLYEFSEAEDLPLFRWSDDGNPRFTESSVTPRRLRVRLIDDEGDAVDGKDVELVGFNDGVKQFGTQADPQSVLEGSYFGPIFLAPFATYKASRGGQVQVAPLWFDSSLWLPELPILVRFSLPEDDLELIERIEVELIRPGG